MVRALDLDLSLSSVAERDGEIVAFLLARRWEDEGVGMTVRFEPDVWERPVPREPARASG
jgi:hypothetical protein